MAAGWDDIDALTARIATLRVERDAVSGWPSAERFSRFVLLANEILRLEKILAEIYQERDPAL